MTAALQTPKLPAEAIALIREGTPKPQVQSPALSPQPANTPDVKVEPPVDAAAVAPAPPAETERTATEQSEARPSKPRVTKEREPVQFEERSNLVSMSFRIPTEIPEALLKASAERKVKRIRPYSQQDIVTEALTQWLKKNDYL